MLVPVLSTFRGGIISDKGEWHVRDGRKGDPGVLGGEFDRKRFGAMYSTVFIVRRRNPDRMHDGFKRDGPNGRMRGYGPVTYHKATIIVQ